MHAILAWPRRLYDWVLHWAETPHAVGALAVLAFAEASFFPVPPDVLLIAMCLGRPKRGMRFAALCSAASVLGGLAGYGIGAALWSQVDTWFYRFVPGFNPARFAQVAALYREYGVLVVFTAGFTPIPFKLFTVASGVLAMPLLPFLGAALVGRAGRFFLVAGLILVFGDPVRGFIDRYFNWLALLFTVLLAGGVLAVRWLL
jgi:membrane protein YqaA with SNARE-associated domain